MIGWWQLVLLGLVYVGHTGTTIDPIYRIRLHDVGSRRCPTNEKLSYVADL